MPYDIFAYSQMLNFEERNSAYCASIRAAVKPGDVVLEIGTATGYMALLACQCGARRVYAIEPADAIVVARQAARDNGFADRIVFHRALSTKVTLPERCDVLISDLRGSSAFYGSHFNDLIDARERLLQEDARWICQQDRFHIAVGAVLPGDELHRCWDRHHLDLNLSSAVRYTINNFVRDYRGPADLLTNTECWATIDYPRLHSPHVHSRVTLTTERDGIGEGLSWWFDATLYGGFGYSNAPGKPPNVYGRSFLPWTRPVELRRGDRVEVRLDVVFASASFYEWHWETSIWRPGRTEALAHFKQSTLQGAVIDKDALRRCLSTYRPRRSPEAEEDLFVLGLIDGRATQGEIATALRAAFPDRYADDAAALARVVRSVAQFDAKPSE